MGACWASSHRRGQACAHTKTENSQTTPPGPGGATPPGPGGATGNPNTEEGPNGAGTTDAGTKGNDGDRNSDDPEQKDEQKDEAAVSGNKELRRYHFVPVVGSFLTILMLLGF